MFDKPLSISLNSLILQIALQFRMVYTLQAEMTLIVLFVVYILQLCQELLDQHMGFITCTDMCQNIYKGHTDPSLSTMLNQDTSSSAW